MRWPWRRKRNAEIFWRRKDAEAFRQRDVASFQQYGMELRQADTFEEVQAAKERYEARRAALQAELSKRPTPNFDPDEYAWLDRRIGPTV